VAAFHEGLKEGGYVEGQNVATEYRWAEGQYDRLPALVAGLVRSRVTVLAATGRLASAQAAKAATATIPIVFITGADPVTRPGGNLIGFSMYEFSIGGKWLDLLKEISPRLARVGVMFNPDTSPQSSFFMRSIEAAAPSLGVQASVIPVRATADIEPAFERFARAPNGG
jgi:putative ABC transport system substrate-binding protein